ncbi:hypothetical protein OSG_eHP14_00105 [environmental Halophage eHP-14]|nr:hypothetical protein OSG_eHP14_00105 [environmental Halophage eHP-14]
MKNSPTPRHRQEVALCILFDELEHPLRGRTYIQKLLFLFQQEVEAEFFYYVAGDYGPFSEKLYEVLEYCVEYDYVTEREMKNEDGIVRYEYEAGPAIEDVFGHGDHADLRAAARTVIEEYPAHDLQNLIEAVYSEYPKYARNSVY